MQSDSLHKEAALLSNTLADFPENDTKGRKEVIDKILKVREAWKDTRAELETGQPRKPAKTQKPTEARLGISEAELTAELKKTRVNISKYKKKIEEEPEHKKRPSWDNELARLEAIREDYETELIRLKYETA